MDEIKEQMRPIWYFVGWVLLAIGLVVLAAGIYNLFLAVPEASMFDHLYPDLWWGGVLIIVGSLYLYINKDVRIKR